jgi:hypothetical protein
VSTAHGNLSSTLQAADHSVYKVYVNSYLGSLNTREFIRFARAKSEGDSRHGISLSTRAPATSVHVERTMLRTSDHKDGRASDVNAAADINICKQFDKTSVIELCYDAKPGDLEAALDDQSRTGR